MDQQNYYCENGYVAKNNLSFVSNFHWNSSQEKTVLKLMCKPQRPWVVKEPLSKNSIAWSNTVLDIKLNYRATVTKAVWYLHKEDI